MLGIVLDSGLVIEINVNVEITITVTATKISALFLFINSNIIVSMLNLMLFGLRNPIQDYENKIHSLGSFRARSLPFL